MIKILPIRKPTLHILDGGGHSVTMNHFSSTILKDTGVSIKSHEIELHKQYSGLKMIKSLKENVENLVNEIKKGDFVAIPASTSAFITNLEYDVGRFLGRSEELNSQNIASKRNIVLNFLEKYAEVKRELETDSIDLDNQGFEHLPGLIKGINKLVAKGANVYIPAGHPADYIIKYKFDEMNEKPYLYRYIATGKDPDGKVEAVLKHLKENRIGKINLLGLSNAHIVTLEDLNKKDYIFGAYNSLVTDRARGVHNFSPVRDKNGVIQGYSFHDTKTPEFLYEEYGGNDNIKDIVKFVGLNIRECLADEKAHKEFKKGKIDPNKIYEMKQILSEQEIDKDKLNYLGEYISGNKEFVFDTNSKDEVLFQKCNCEGSERPSVVSMWGSCFATFNKIKEDICANKSVWQRLVEGLKR